MSDAPTGTALRIHDVSHTYGDQLALDRVSLDVRAGEFLSLLGPSGCGKTTLLRVIAGFTRPTAGSVSLDGEDVTTRPPHKRRVNMVFQRFSLFPNLDVFDNVAFGLRLAKVPRSEIDQRVREALALVRLEDLAHRRPEELSGGQAQRVALARALINRPEVLLLDEPLSALDLRIRLQMEVELRRVHRESGATIIYVTHDQREALAMSDRIAVFDRGRVVQLGDPSAVYSRPTSRFTASFVGDANVLPIAVSTDGNGRASVALGDVPVAPVHLPAASGVPRGPAWLVIRQEDITVRPAAGGQRDGSVPGVVLDVGFRGDAYTYRVHVPGLPDPLRAEAPLTGSPALSAGTEVTVTWNADAAVVLAGDA